MYVIYVFFHFTCHFEYHTVYKAPANTYLYTFTYRQTFTLSIFKLLNQVKYADQLQH